MNAPVNADLWQNIISTIYLLFAHNYIAFAYFTGVVIGIGLAFYRPSRFSTLVLLGFAILLFSFEYDKHIIEPLRQQTLNSLITGTPHYKVQRIINLLISDILPILFYICGWVLIFTALIRSALKEEKKKK
jgi:ABC-type dipeptide/oligopeptide/nickel transport system permease component